MGPQLLLELEMPSVSPLKPATSSLGSGAGDGSRSPPGLPRDVERRQPCGLLGPPACLFSFDLKVWPQTREFEVLLF